MRPPWLQFERGAMERCAALATWLSDDDLRMRGRLTCAWDWACTLGPEDGPPDGIARGPNAARRLAAEMRWTGPPDLLVEAMEATGFLQLLPDGFRIRGTSRYRRLWEKNQRPSQSQREANSGKSGSSAPDNAGPAPEPAKSPPVDLDLEEETKRDPKREAEEFPPAADQEGGTSAAGNPFADVPPPPDPEGVAYPEASDCWEWMRALRAECGRPLELRMPKGFERWHHIAVREAGVEGIQRAYERYLAGTLAADRGWPTAVFMTPHVWSTRTYPEPPRKARL